MPIGKLTDLINNIPADARLLGLDVGKKTIGLALSGPDLAMATPLHTIKRTKFTQDAQELAKIVREYEVGGFIIGLPLNMDGSEGPRAQSVRDFAAEFYKYLKQSSSRRKPGSSAMGDEDPVLQRDDALSDPWIAFWDERLSTASVEDLVDNYVEKRKTKINSKSSGLIDKLAAQIILQGALNHIRQNS